MMKLVLATRNPGKAEEILYAVSKSLEPERILMLSDFPSPPHFEEMGDTFEENARAKALFYSRWIEKAEGKGYYVLAEDAGLEVALLQGFPGIVSSRIAKTDRERINIVLGALSEADKDDLLTSIDDWLPEPARLAPNISRPSRSARFFSAMALARDGRILHVTTGEVNGLITFEPMGTNGFGYDPVFYCPQLGKTFGECSRDEKATVSHRARAIKKMLEFIQENILGTVQDLG